MPNSAHNSTPSSLEPLITDFRSEALANESEVVTLAARMNLKSLGFGSISEYVRCSILLAISDGVDLDPREVY